MRKSLRLGQEDRLSMCQFLKRLSTSSQRRLLVVNVITGYERSVTGCGFQRSHVSQRSQIQFQYEVNTVYLRFR